MTKLFKGSSILLVAVIMSTMLSGCYDRREVDDLAYVMAIGIDKGKTNFVKLTFQIAKPLGGGDSGGGGGGGGGEEVATIATVEAPSLTSGLNMVNTFVSRQVNLSHAKAVIFSEALAKEGLEPYINGMIRAKEFRPNVYIGVARGEAEDYIRSIKPQLEPSIAKYYELNFKSYRFTGFSSSTELHDFYNYSKSLYRQPLAVLAGVNKFNPSEDFNLDSSTYKEKGRHYALEGDFKAGDVTKSGDLKGEIIGLAVFDGMKMVGELDGEETTCHLMTSGEYKYAYISIPDPKFKDKFVVLNVKQSRKPRNKVEMVNGKPQIDVKVILEADILTIQSGAGYEEAKKVNILENAAEDFIKKEIEDYLKKTAKEYHSDIDGFGGKMKGKFLTWQEWEKFNWKSRYKDAVFHVDVQMDIRRPGLLVRSLPVADSKRKGE